MPSLAPIRYSRVLTKHGGPVERLEYGEIRVQGTRRYQANAYLSSHLNLKKADNVLFSAADGSGTDRSAMVARHKAISEALERWAYHYIFQSGDRSSHGFKQDDTTSGMAAFPGLLKGSVRELARLEAEERYCLVHWWKRWLPHTDYSARLPGVQAVRIRNPLSEAVIILCWRKCPCGWTAYGTGAAGKGQTALWKAVIEMERAVTALEGFHGTNPGFDRDDLPALSNHLERRLLHFAMPEGTAAFMERLSASKVADGNLKEKPIIDHEIKGPWDKYATVWRVLYPLQSREHLDPHRLTFFW